mmetsp:Transcript_26890/g.79470  ORF Transcript_26890/g.79470 Transcript_26890/m.79470 type:complete len:113 (-) Transcript_26890:137-475(-)
MPSSDPLGASTDRLTANSPLGASATQPLQPTETHARISTPRLSFENLPRAPVATAVVVVGGKVASPPSPRRVQEPPAQSQAQLDAQLADGMAWTKHPLVVAGGGLGRTHRPL